jgi:hypothetical protein
MGSPEFSALKSRFATTVAPGSGAWLSLAEQRAASEHFGDLATEPDGSPLAIISAALSGRQKAPRIWVAESDLERAVAARGRVGHVLH